MSGSVTTLLPSFHAASPWSTLTLRTSLSLMKGTGWSEGKHCGQQRRQVIRWPLLKTTSPSPGENPSRTSFMEMFFFFNLSYLWFVCDLCLEDRL